MAREQQDWLKLHRSMADNPFLKHDKNAAMLFINLLLLANKTKGQWSGGLRELTNLSLFTISYSSIYRTMSRLEKEGMVKQETKRRYTVITICNWNKYQSFAKQEPDHKRSTSEAHAKQPKEVNVGQSEIKSENKKINKKVEVVKKHEQLQPALGEFVKMRKLIKKPLTDLAIDRLVKRLQKMYPDDPIRQQGTLLQSVDKGWQDVYELKQAATPERRFA